MSRDLRLLIEDQLRTTIMGNVNITHRTVFFSNGCNPATLERSVVEATHHPMHYRMSLVKYYYFEMCEINSEDVDSFKSAVIENLLEIRSIPPLDLGRLWMRLPRMIDINDFYDNIYSIMLDVVNDAEWWEAMAGRLTCSNQK